MLRTASCSRAVVMMWGGEVKEVEEVKEVKDEEAMPKMA